MLSLSVPMLGPSHPYTSPQESSAGKKTKRWSLPSAAMPIWWSQLCSEPVRFSREEPALWRSLQREEPAKAMGHLLPPLRGSSHYNHPAPDTLLQSDERSRKRRAGHHTPGLQTQRCPHRLLFWFMAPSYRSSAAVRTKTGHLHAAAQVRRLCTLAWWKHILKAPCCSPKSLAGAEWRQRFSTSAQT